MCMGTNVTSSSNAHLACSLGDEAPFKAVRSVQHSGTASLALSKQLCVLSDCVRATT